VALNFVSRSPLRITAVETIHTRYQLSRPTGPAGAFNAARQALIVKISTDSGLVGWGETYALAGVRAAIEDVLAPSSSTPRKIRA